MNVVGEFSETIAQPDLVKTGRVHVCRERPKEEPLAEVAAIAVLNLVVMVNATETYQSTILDTYFRVFQGLGSFEDPYDIKLKPSFLL